jgi:transcriptional regulator
MKGYGSIREVKTTKEVSVLTDRGVEEYEQHDATYGWKDIEGTVTLSLDAGGKHITLLKLSESLYRRITLSVKSDDDIEEIVQKQLKVEGAEEKQEEDEIA